MNTEEEVKQHQTSKNFKGLTITSLLPVCRYANLNNMDYRAKIELIRSEYIHGKINLKTAEDAVKPLLEQMNIKGAEIARKHGKKFRPLTFGYIFR